MFKKWVYAACLMVLVAATACGPSSPATTEPLEEPPTQTTAQPTEPAAEPQEEPTEDTASAEEPTEEVSDIAPALLESPMLHDLVEAGELPPLEERLPVEPLVVTSGLLVDEEDLPDFTVGEYSDQLTVIMGNTIDGAIVGEPLLAAPGIGMVGIYPNVLADYEVSDDYKEFTFYMRKGLKWSDGVPVTTEDIRFTWEDLYANPDFIASPPAKWTSSAGTPMEVDIIDDYTFRFTFDEPRGSLIREITIAGWISYDDILRPSHFLKQFHIEYADPSELEARLDEAGLAADQWPTLLSQYTPNRWQYFSAAAIGIPVLLPWYIVEETAEAQIYERNPYYFKVDQEGKQLPYFDKIVRVQLTDPQTVDLRQIAGDADYAWSMDPTKFPLYRQNADDFGYTANIVRAHLDPLTIWVNSCNEDPVVGPILKDVRFRRALDYAINRDEVVQSVYLGFADANINWPHYEAEYSPEKANQLLDEIGLDVRDSEGFRLAPDGSPLVITLEAATQRVEWVIGGELLAEQFKEVGVNVQFEQLDRAFTLQRLAANEAQLVIYHLHAPLWSGGGWSDYLPDDAWCPVWAQWDPDDPDEGVEPPDPVKRLMEIGQQRSEYLPNTPEDDELADEIFQIVGEQLYFIPAVTNREELMYVSNDMHDVPVSGFSFASRRAAEIFWKEP